jgi:hypothetical protein
MNTRRSLKKLLRTLRVEGRLSPVSDRQLATFESLNKIKLPASYRTFCKVFGPGCLRGRIEVHIAVPGLKLSEDRNTGELVKESVEVLNKEIWSTRFIDLDEYCPNPNLVRKGLFFGRDIYTHHYFWNKSEVTDKQNNELGVYVIYREWAIHRLADSFESFIFNICLDKGIPNHSPLDEDPPTFEPASLSSKL